MAGNGMYTGSEQRVMIKNSYLEEHASASGSGKDIDLLTLTPYNAFVGLNKSQGRGIPKSGALAAYNPRAVSVNTYVSEDQAVDYGLINGKGLNDPYFMIQRFEEGHIHRVGLRTIRPNGTTARGIIIHA
jgi:hypothetical protein